MAWVWRWFYQPVPIGVINDVLSSFGIPQQPFLRSTTQALPAVLAPAIWAGLGFQIIIFLAGLRAIPVTYYEAARIDGLSEGAILRRITLPLLKPTIVFLVVFSSIGFLRIFDQVYNMTTNDPGGPLNATKPLVLMIYQTAFQLLRDGICGGADGRAVRHPARHLARPAAHHEGPLMKDSRILPGSFPLSRIRPGTDHRLDAPVHRRRHHGDAAPLHVLDLAQGRLAGLRPALIPAAPDARQLHRDPGRRALHALVRQLDDRGDHRHPLERLLRQPRRLHAGEVPSSAAATSSSSPSCRP